VDNQLSQLSSLLCDLTDASGGVLANLNIEILEAVEDAREDLSLNDDLSKVDGVLGNLSET
jgi:hypothetical protein